MRKLTICVALTLAWPSVAWAADFPSVSVPPSPLGAIIGERVFTLQMATVFAEGRTAYGPMLDYRSKKGFVVGLGILPFHENRGDFETRIGISGRFDMGYSFVMADIEAGSSSIQFGGGFRGFGLFGSDPNAAAAGGGSISLGVGVKGPPRSGVESVHVFGEYVPIIAGLTSDSNKDPQLHSIRVGAVAIYDVDREGGLTSGLLVSGAVELREIADGAVDPVYQVGIGLAF